MSCKLGIFSVVVLAVLNAAPCVEAQVETGAHARPRITQSIDETNRVSLEGNTHPEARPANDRGTVANDFAMEHMLLQLKRSPEQEKALQQFIDELHTKGSPNFHRWLTAQEFGERFGMAKPDLDAVSGWLESHGFKVNVVYPNGMVIDFSGTAAQVRKAFQTEIHHLEVKGEKQIANISDPRIPAALAPVLAGVVSLHDFRPHTMYKMRRPKGQFTFPDSLGGTNYAVVPADLATIYNLNPLFSAGLSGQGQTIVLIEDTDVFSASDWSSFRSTLGLSGYTSASFTQVHPRPSSGPNNCGAPGVFAPNDAEAILDAEWASAAAPSAAIEMAACADTTTTFGGLIAVQNLINANSVPPSIMSISYGQCETVNGAAANAAYNSTYQQAVAEGVSVFVAAGDSGAAGCDNSVAEATHGIGVNAFASTAYNVAVGGTDFSDTYNNTNATYWNSSNTTSFGSAISYVPEIPWNDSCAGLLFTTYEGFSPTYGSTSLCNDPSLGPFVLSTIAGGGGPSQCATGAPSTAGVVSGSCAGWAKPSWQNVLGNPNDGVRDTPDVSLFAADGLWSHYYVFCWSDTTNGGAACGSDPSAWSGAGGTSFASPIMAGIQALINQKAGGPQGNPAPVYYQLAAAEYGSSGSSSCNSSSGNTVASSCIFYDVTFGDMDVDCVGPNCYLGGGSVGVLSTSNTSFAPASGTTVGWDFATGIGTVNAANLVNNWPGSATQPSFTLSASSGSLTFLQGAAGSTTITIQPLNGFSGSVNLTASGLPSGVSATFGTNPATTTSVLTLSATSNATIGTFSLTVTGTSGNITGKTTITVTVNPVGDYALSASSSSLSLVQGTSGKSTITVSPQNGFNGKVSLSASGLPSGVTASFNPTSTPTTSTLTLTASNTAALGTVTITIAGASGNLSHATTITLTVTPLPNFTLAASPSSLAVTQGTIGTSTISVAPQNGFTGNVNLSASGLPSGVTASFSPNPATATSTLTLTASTTAITGAATVTITGTSGSLSHSTSISLTVRMVPTLPSVWSDGDVGSPGVAGSVSYSNGTFTVQGAGGQIYGNADTFHYVYQPMAGDGTIVARVVSLQGGSSYVSAGVMIREALSADSTNAKTADWRSYGAIYFDVRSTTGGSTTEPGGVSATLPYWVKVTRSGGIFSSYTSSDGMNWTQVGTSQTISMAQNVYVGLTVTSGTTTALATATFDNVSVNLTPAQPLPNPWLDQDVGSVGVTGSARFSNGTFTVQGAGAQIYGTADAFHNVYQPLSGDGTIIARLVSLQGGSTYVSAGVMIRETLNTGSTNAKTADWRSYGTIYFDVRTTTGGSTVEPGGVSATLPYWVKVARSGSTFTSYTSSDGVNWVQLATSQTINMAQNAFVGLAVTSGTTTALAAATFDNVSVSSSPAPPPNYTLSTSPSSLNVTQGANGTSTITVTPQNGFTGNVNLSASGLPSGVTASFSPNPATTTSTLTLTASSTATTGTATITITGASGSSTNTTTASVNVNPVAVANFALSASPSSLAVTQGAIGTSTISVAPQNGFTGNVNLSASGLPSGVTASFSPNPATATSTLTLTASTTAITGAATVTITGTSGNLSHSTSIALTVQMVPTLPSVWSDGDIGSPGVAGSVSYSNGTFTVQGAGGQIYGNADTFHYVYQPMAGNGTIIARLVSLQGGSGYVTAGVMIRETLNAGATNAKTADWAAYGGIYFDVRSTTGGSTTEPGGVSATLPYWVKVTRSGGIFSSYTSSDGVNWTQLGTSQTISMAQNVYVGLAVNSGSNSALATATFDNVSVNLTSAQPLPNPWLDQDVGTVGVAGSASYSNGTFTVQGAGAQIYGTADAFHYVCQPMAGDGTIVARVVSLQGGSSYVAAGVMIRETLSASATNAKTADWRSYGTIYFDVRATTGGSTTEPGGVSAALPYWVRVTRSGNTFTSYTSPDGMNWTQLGTSQTISMTQNAYVGFAATSGTTTALATVTFDNVSVTSP